MKLFLHIKILLFFVSFLSTSFSSIAQAKGDTIPQVSFITCYAGSDVYELCGHSALRIKYLGNDIAVNYGLFDFDSPNFVYRFVKGETDYQVGAYPFYRFLSQYTRDNRRIVEQKLNLTPTQALKLVELININLLPQNRVYRYNYVKDNCATRPIAMIERAIGDTVTFYPTTTTNTYGWTFRDEMRHFHKNYPWYQFGIDLALGTGIDYIISEREKGFAPELLEQLLQTATITDSIGNAIPLITSTETLNEGNPNGAQYPLTPWYLSPLFCFSLLLIIVILITLKDFRNQKISKWLDSVLFTAYGLAGCILTFLIFVSVHEATSPNWLYAWLNPLCFIPGILIWLKKCNTILYFYHFANFVVLLLLIISWYWLGQSANIAFIPLILCSLIRSASYLYIYKCDVKTTK